MILVENVDVYGWETAIRGMRNPMNSWDKSDSKWGCSSYTDGDWCSVDCWDCNSWQYIIGENDLKLMKNLARAGSDHAKYLRMINVTMDITAPLFWWKEFDTYKVGTVANSCSTMHKIHDKEFTLDDFSHEHLIDSEESWLGFMEQLVDALNVAREIYLEEKDKKYWWQMIQLLPSSYNQKRTVQMNYQVCWNMYQARKNHKLDEWRTLCGEFLILPYFRNIFLEE